MKRFALALLALVAVFALPSTASAVPQISEVTQPSVFTAYKYEDAPRVQESFTVAGTANFGPVDINCYPIFTGSSPITLAQDVPVDAGSFSTTVQAGLGYSCMLRAVPANTTPSDFTNLTGKPISMNYLGFFASTGKNYDYYAYFGQKLAGADYDSVKSCGLCDTYLIDQDTYKESAATFYANQFYSTDIVTARSPLQIDGRNAFASAQDSSLTELAGFLSPEFTYAFDPGTGNVTMTEKAPLMTCQNNVASPDKNNCDAIVALPVRLVRTMTQDHDGLLTTIRDRYEGTDGNDHTFSVAYGQSMCMSSSSCSTNMQWDVPGSPTLLAPANQVVSGLPDGSTIKISDSSKPDGDKSSGRSAISISPAADDISFAGQRRAVINWNNRLIPAGGAYNIVGRFASAYDESTLSGLTAPALTGGGTVAPNPASVVKSGKISAKYDKKKRLVNIASGNVVNCPAGGKVCAVTATLQTKYKKGKKTRTYKFKRVTLTIQPGASSPITFKLSSVKNNPLYKGSSRKGYNPISNKKFSFTGAVTATATGATPTTGKLSFKLKLPKIPKKK